LYRIVKEYLSIRGIGLNSTKRLPLLITIVVLLLSLCIFSPIRCVAALANTAPNFSLAGIDGKQHSLSEVSGKPSVLFFFCGCKWCHSTAESWAKARIQDKDLSVIRTIIVYSGDAADAQRFLIQTGLDSPSTTILLDQYLHVTLDLYQAEPCPRVFVLSKQLSIVYTNNHKNDYPRTIDGSELIQHVVSALTLPIAEGSSSAVQPPIASPPNTPEVFLTPIAGKGVTVTGNGSNAIAHYDFGTVTQGATSTVDHIFQFRNNTPSPVVIGNIQPSCGCTTAAAEESSVVPFSVQPSQTINILVSVDLTQLIPSPVDKTVWIYGNSEFRPLGVIDVNGTLVAGQ